MWVGGWEGSSRKCVFTNLGIPEVVHDKGGGEKEEEEEIRSDGRSEQEEDTTENLGSASAEQDVAEMRGEVKVDLCPSQAYV